MRFLGFDIETAAAVPADRADSYALGITCVAFFDGSSSFTFHGPEQPDGRYSLRMAPEDVRNVAKYLLMEIRHRDFTLATINGLSFDLRVLAEECQDLDLEADLRRIAWENHVDPCWQMVCKKGFPVGMAAMAEAFRLQGKTEGMDGLEAIKAWRGTRQDQEKVLEYVRQDARVTWQICQSICVNGGIHWITKAGKPSSTLMSLRVARDGLRYPEPNMSWWTGDPPKRSDFCGWLDDNQD